MRHWQTSGAVDWEDSGVTFGAGGVLARSVEVDEPVWFSAVLEQVGAETVESETRLELVYEDGGCDWLSVARRMSGNRPVCRVQVVCERPSGAKDPVRREILDRQYDVAWAAGHWELRWQRGTLTPVRDAQPLGTCIPNSNLFWCNQTRLVQTSGQVRIREVQLRSPQPTPVTAEERARRTQIAARLIDVRRESARGNMAQANQALADAVAYARQRYGEDHGVTVVLARAGANLAKSPEVVDGVLPICEKLTGRESEEYGSLLIQRGTLSPDEQEVQRWSEDGLAILRRVLRREDPKFTGPLYDVGWNLHRRNLHRQAEPLLREAAELRAQTLGADHPYYAAALNGLAMAQQAQGKYAEAKAAFEQALDIFRKTEDRRFLSDRAVVLTNLGFLLSNVTGEYAQAEPRLREALHIRRDLFGARSEPYYVTLNALGICYKGWNRTDEAEAAYREALEIARERHGPQSEDVGNILHNLAKLRFDQDDFVGAADLARQALEQRDFGVLQVDASGHVPAELLRRLSPNTLNTVDLSAEIAVQLGDLPHVLLMYAVAKSYWEAVHGKEHPAYTAAVAHFAWRLVSLRQPDLALAFIQEDLAVLDKACAADTADAALTATAISQVLRAAGGDLKRARQYAERAVAIRDRKSGRRSHEYVAALNELGNVQQVTGEWDAAAETFRTALELSVALGDERSFDSLAILTNLGGVEHQRQHDDESLRLLRRALDLRWERLQLVAEAAHEGQLLTLGEEFRRCLVTFLAAGVRAQSDPAEAYAQVLRGKGLAFMLQRHRRLSRDQPELKPLFDELQQTSRRLAAMDSQIASGAHQAARLKEYGDLQEQKQKLEQEIAAQSRVYRSATKALDLSADAIRRALPRDAALVDFVTYWQDTPNQQDRKSLTSELRTVAFVLRRDEAPVRLDLGSGQPIADAVDAWRREIVRGAGGSALGPIPTNAGNGANAAPQAELKRRIWQPIEQHLAGAKVVLISPDEILAHCPFAALPGKEPGSYLLEEWPLVLCPTPQLLVERQTADDALSSVGDSVTLLLVGDVDFGASPGTISPATAQQQVAQPAVRFQEGQREFAPLPGTAREIQQVQELCATIAGQNAPVVLRGDKATEDAVRMAFPGVQYIHVATHGYFAQDEDLSSQLGTASAGAAAARWFVRSYNPDLLSGLALAGGNHPPGEEKVAEGARDDGILTAAEVAACDLRRAKLVVLSACETGLGKNSGGEGLLGLRRSFHVAGASSVVASLWKVDDTATQTLMQRFYDNLLVKRLPKLEALRESQLWMLSARTPEELASRGGTKRLAKVSSASLDSGDRLPPYYWAAFLLSGDWQ